MRPFNVVEGEGFLKLMKEVAPLYKVPSSVHLKKKLTEKYDVTMLLFKERIDRACTVCLTLDIWTETMAEKGYLGVTIHFLEGTEPISCAIATRELDDRHTAKYIAQTLETILGEWCIPLSKIRCIVTDNGQNMVAAVKILITEKNHLPCFPHTMNLVVQAGLKDADIEIILEKVRKIVKWVKNSVVNSDKMRKIQIKHGVPEASVKKMILDVCTRWNSVFYMVERFIDLIKFTSELLLDNFLGPDMPTSQEIETLKQLIILLQPFEYLTREISGENYIVISKVIPMVNCVISALQKYSSSCLITTSIAETFLMEMKRRFGKIEFNSHLSISTLLDPRFKNVHFKDDLACSQAILKLRTVIKEHTSVSSNTSDSELETSPLKSFSNFDFRQHHRDLVAGKKRKRQGTGRTDEIGIYLSSPLSSHKSNPLEEWEDIKVTFPQLYNQARLFLSVVGSSVPCERLFSKAGTIISKNRNRLSGKYLEKLLFLGNMPYKLFFIIFFSICVLLFS